jgi:4-amino-4-deoxy-L-arabinose transferase-like glycosyltransferase
MMRLRAGITAPALCVLLAAIATASLYTAGLGYAPVYVSHDEAFFAIHAHAIAKSGRDLDGSLWPLYIHLFDRYWAQPLHIYSQALFVRMFSLSEAVVRLPSALVGLIDVLLMFLVGRKLFKSTRLGLIAAGLLALTPSHFFHSRMAADPIFPLAFVLAWLLCLASYEESNRPSQLFGATVVLGLGVYSYIGSLLMMPLYFLVTCGVLLGRRDPPRRFAVAALGFVSCLAPLVTWLLFHPHAYADQLHRYQVVDTHGAGLFRSLVGLFGYTSLTARTSIYWSAFSPSMLFFSGDSSLLNATRKAGIFLFPVAVFLPVGLNHIVNARPTRLNLAVLTGLLTAPLGAVFAGELFLPRELIMVPFAIVAATTGVACFLSARLKFWRVVGVVLLALAPVQFAYFAYDYFTDYRLRSSGWFEQNLRGTLEEAIAREQRMPGRTPYLSGEILWIDAYWRFYLAKHDQASLLDRTVYYSPAHLDVQSMPRGALIVGKYGEPAVQALVQAGELRQLDLIVEPNGTPSFVICER